ncbi:MAG: hypothetical protein ACREUS_05510 [Burkholderiales bacterium]
MAAAQLVAIGNVSAYLPISDYGLIGNCHIPRRWFRATVRAPLAARGVFRKGKKVEFEFMQQDQQFVITSIK